MKLFLFLFVFLFIHLSAFSQSILKVIVIDKTTNDVIPQTRVVFNSKSTSTNRLTNRKGEAFFDVNPNDSISITTQHIAYDDSQRSLKPNDLKKDTTTITFLLRYSKSTNLAEVTVKPSGVPDTIFESKRVSVDDFEFLPNGNLLLLTYEGNKRKGTSLLLYDGFEVITEIELAENGKELIRDFRGNPHVIAEKDVFTVSTEGNQVNVGAIEKGYFMTYIAPIVDTTVSKYFFSDYNPIYPAFQYFTYDLLDSTYKKIANIKDDLMMELYRSEYKWVDVRTKLWAKEKEHETGIDAEIWVGANYFTRSIYYKELYAPLFERNDTIFVFDHYKNWLYRYTKTGERLDSLPIFYHLQEKKSGWQKQLIQDQTTGQIYSVYENFGRTTLKRIDVHTGEVKESIPLSFNYPQHIAIRSNSVYYTYRPFESPQKKFLYSEKMPFSFSKALVNEGDKLVR